MVVGEMDHKKQRTLLKDVDCEKSAIIDKVDIESKEDKEIVINTPFASQTSLESKYIENRKMDDRITDRQGYARKTDSGTRRKKST